MSLVGAARGIAPGRHVLPEGTTREGDWVLWEEEGGLLRCRAKVANNAIYCHAETDASGPRRHTCRADVARYLLQQPSVRAPSPNVASALEWLAEQHESDAKQVPMGAAFKGGPLHNAPIYGVHAWAARKARELAAAIRRGKARPPLGTSEAAEWSTRSILGAAADSQPAPTDTREPEVWEDDAALVARAAEACHHLHGRSLPRWSHLGATFGIGSGSATKLARRLGLDPDEVIGGIPEDAELDEDDERSDTREPAPTKGKRCVVCGEPSLGDRWCSIECHRRGDTSTPSSEPSDEAHDAWSRWDADREARGQSIPTYETWMAGWYARAAQDIYERRKAIEAEPAPKVVEGPPEDEPDIIDYTVDGLRLRWVSSIDGAVVHEVLVPGARPACQDFHLYVELRDALGCPRTMKHDDVIARARGATHARTPDARGKHREDETLTSEQWSTAIHEALGWDGTVEDYSDGEMVGAVRARLAPATATSSRTTPAPKVEELPPWMQAWLTRMCGVDDNGNPVAEAWDDEQCTYHIEWLLEQASGPAPKGEPSRVVLNINDKVRWVPTEAGARVFNAHQYQGLPPSYQKPIERVEAGKPHEEQLWVLMAALGPKTLHGGDQLIEGNVIMVSLERPDAPKGEEGPRSLGLDVSVPAGLSAAEIDTEFRGWWRSATWPLDVINAWRAGVRWATGRSRGATQEPDSGRLAEQLKSARADLVLMKADRDYWKAKHEALASRVWDGTHGHKAAELARREGLVEGYQMAIGHLAEAKAGQWRDAWLRRLETNPNRPELDDTSRNGR